MKSGKLMHNNLAASTEIHMTLDGSHTLFIPLIEESYHSTHGAIQESEFIYMNAGLKFCAKKEITVFEVGFGTGLNAFLTLLEAERQQLKIHYITVEKYPVVVEDALKLNYTDIIASDKKALFGMMHYWQWNQPVQLTPEFILEKVNADFVNFEHFASYDVIYFDAFSPEKQQEMWTQELFEKLFAHCNDNAVLVTYCAKGAVRRAMQKAGFAVERLAGPPGKREILRATKIQQKKQE